MRTSELVPGILGVFGAHLSAGVRRIGPDSPHALTPSGITDPAGPGSLLHRYTVGTFSSSFLFLAGAHAHLACALLYIHFALRFTLSQATSQMPTLPNDPETPGYVAVHARSLTDGSVRAAMEPGQGRLPLPGGPLRQTREVKRGVRGPIIGASSVLTNTLEQPAPPRPAPPDLWIPLAPARRLRSPRLLLPSTPAACDAEQSSGILRSRLHCACRRAVKQTGTSDPRNRMSHLPSATPRTVCRPFSSSKKTTLRWS